MTIALAIVLAVGTSGQVAAKAVARVPARALTAGELASSATQLDHKLVDALAGQLHVQRTQAFAIATPAGEYWLEPVLYEANNPDTGNTSPRCGVFLLKANDKPVFLPTLGAGWTNSETCTDLEGVGFSAGNGAGSAMPRILLLYAASSPNFSTREPIVLDWNEATHSYQGNEKVSLALTHKGGNVSIAGMKRRLAEVDGAAK